MFNLWQSDICHGIHSLRLIVCPLTSTHIFPLPLFSSSVTLIFISLCLLLLFMSAVCLLPSWSYVVSSQLSRSVCRWLYTDVNLLLQMDFFLLSTTSSAVWKLLKSSIMVLFWLCINIVCTVPPMFCKHRQQTSGPFSWDRAPKYDRIAHFSCWVSFLRCMGYENELLAASTSFDIWTFKRRDNDSVFCRKPR